MTNGTDEKKTVHTITPVVDIVETAKSYVVKLDIPGSVKEKIKASIENNTLVISTEASDYAGTDSAETAKQYRREFLLAKDIDVDTVDAQYDLGVLTVTLNKKKQFLPKQISIN
ncbi:MAG: Hsp20/alpha crystallin family protein [Bacteroidota bacterium]